ncbi:hypothetical protein LPW36_01845 [Jinshanibacter sp. LJY008]|uniref:Glycosyltransferase n=1 Tax=Limnobaculum eriocheiris TaxID=2897391 RepID=A0A9X1MSL6_9GAMM|nr:hypothetical protein [Limnobaculum eriocheiris]MCD1124786.1 hypothetical protein [Limnobaculum eriocheiris]
MTIIVDILRQNDEHNVFNSKAITALLSTSTITEVWLTKNSTCNVLLDREINVKKRNVRSFGSKFYYWFISSFITVYILFRAYFRKESVLFLSATPLHYYIISKFLLILNLNIYIIMHGELSYLNHPIGLGQKIGGWCINKSFLSYKVKKLTYIALGFPIYSLLLEIYPSLAGHITIVEHPLDDITFSKKNDKKLCFGSFGIHSKDKNSEKIYDLALCIDENIIKSIDIITVGISDGYFKYGRSDNILHYCAGVFGKNFIPREEFVMNVNKIDFALFFYNGDTQYALVPSGIFYDCISFNIPIISLKNRIFQAYFEKYGPMGKLCNNLDEMADFIKLLYLEREKCEEYFDNMKSARDDMSFNNFRDNLLRIIQS